MKRINLKFTENIYKQNENGVEFDSDGNGIILEKKDIEFVLTFNIDENINVKQMQIINKCFSQIKEGEEIEGMIEMIKNFVLEKENIELIDKLSVEEFTKLSDFITGLFSKITENTQKKIMK